MRFPPKETRVQKLDNVGVVACRGDPFKLLIGVAYAPGAVRLVEHFNRDLLGVDGGVHLPPSARAQDVFQINVPVAVARPGIFSARQGAKRVLDLDPNHKARLTLARRWGRG